MEDRDLDKKTHLCKENSSTKMVSIDQIKSLFIAEGLSPEEIVTKIPFLTVERVERIVEEHKLEELRKAYMREGLTKIQNVQLDQANRLMNLEANFKRLRLLQLEDKLKDYSAYFQRHGDFYKRHPVSGDILRDTDGIPLQLTVPNVVREINQIKESVSLSEGLKKLLAQIDDIINPPPTEDSDSIELDLDQFFSSK